MVRLLLYKFMPLALYNLVNLSMFYGQVAQ